MVTQLTWKMYKMIGFANKGNAMKTIKSNFTLDEDYKVALFHSEKRKNEGGVSDNTQIFHIKDEALEYVNANYKLNY
jgi:hypothetical protein